MKKKFSVVEPLVILPEKIDHAIRNMDKYHCNLSVNVTYVNNTGVTVYLYTRDGVVTEFPPCSQNFSVGQERFEIHKEHHFLGINFNISTPLDFDETFKGNAEREIYRKQHEADIEGVRQHPGTRSARFVKFSLTQAELQQKQSVHITNLDIVLSLLPPKEGISHPLTLHGDNYRLFHDIFKDMKLDWLTSFNILFIDNEDTFGDRYINVSGKALKITKTKSIMHCSGFYVFHLDGTALKPPKYYKSEEDLLKGEDLILYKSYEEAYTGGSPKSIYELEVLNKKIEFDKLKHQHEKESFEFKKQIDELTNSFREKEYQYKKELNDLNREYETQTLGRKKLSEDVKWGLGIASAILGAVATIIVTMKPKS